MLPDTGKVGSVGVLQSVCDCTEANKLEGIEVAVITSGKRKVDGHPDTKLTPEVEGRLQATVDSLADVFFDHVASRRGMTPDAVRALDGENFLGKDAVGAGLADSVGSFDDFVAMCTGAAVAAQKTADEAEKAKRMQQFATRLGLAASASENDILAGIDGLKARALAGDEAKIKASSIDTAFREHLTGWAIETGRATVGEATELKSAVPAESLARILSARKPMASLPTETKEPAESPKAQGSAPAPGALPSHLVAIAAKEYSAMTNHERQSLAIGAPSLFASKRHDWALATGANGDVVVGPAYVGTTPPR
jgi:hypothetical protein